MKVRSVLSKQNNCGKCHNVQCLRILLTFLDRDPEAYDFQHLKMFSSSKDKVFMEIRSCWQTDTQRDRQTSGE